MDNKKTEKLNEIIEVYKQIYFTHDEPIPFKTLYIYPVLVEDYYNFYALIDIFTVNKNEDKTGKGIGMTNLDYLIYLTRDENSNSEAIIRKIIGMFELIFHIKNGIKCSCDEDNDTFISYDDIYQKVDKQCKEKNVKDISQLSITDIGNFFTEIRICPKCGKSRPDVIRFNNVGDKKTDFIVDGVEITDDDFDLLRKVVCYYNMPDQDDEYIDPELKAEMEEAAKLENPERISPTLEKQETCIIASTSYTYETIKKITIRHLVLLLRTVDAKLHYFTYRQAEASGMVTFKGEIQHWIYSADKPNKFDKLQTLDQLKDKLGGAAKTS